ncbi:MAG: Gfo/Idh/MocA family oxidoreductase [Chloroflexi bacterium]|nr:Gfo/Idh/MocA family oxidoreductase [Chloroflexota bacterium]
MPAKIRVGIVGATVTPGGSGWGANAHVPAIKNQADYELRAVCTAHPETAEASRDKFGAEMAFHDFDAMVARPDIDLVSVVVRVPGHKDLVIKALNAGKNVFCEWPLGRDVHEAEEMASLAAQKGVTTAVGLQGRSDPSLMYARELIQQGFIGRLLAVNYNSVSQAVTERGNGRIWQGDRRNGANTLTIAAGHAIDAVCYLAGEFTEVNARLDTIVTEWHNTDTGETMKVDSPDWIDVSGKTAAGADISFFVATVPSQAGGTRWEIYGTEGMLQIEGSANMGGRLLGAKGKDKPEPLEVPERLRLASNDTPAGPPRNVAQGYERIAGAIAAGQPYHPDFAHAVTRHKLIDAIERSSHEGRTVKL